MKDSPYILACQETAAPAVARSPQLRAVFFRKRSLLLLLLPLSLLLLWISRHSPAFAEVVFAQGITKLLGQGMSLLTGLLPFSLMEVQVILAPVLAGILVIRFILRMRRAIRSDGRAAAAILAGGICNAAILVSVVLFLFVLFAGVNYYRYPFAYYSGLAVEDSSVEELHSLSVRLASEAHDLRELLPETSGNDAPDWAEASARAAEAYETLSRKYPVFAGSYGPPKPVAASRLMSSLQITGIFWPFTMEANVNADVPAYGIYATMCHELAHARGFMREDEANFIAYLACRSSEDVRLQYSGVMLALQYVTGQLWGQSAELYREVRALYSEGMLSDLQKDAVYWAQFQNTTISAVSSTVNDAYLKVNNQSDGVRSYGRMVDLLLAEHRVYGSADAS